MTEMKDENRPGYADYDSAAKFQAIQGIIITRLRWHPKAICSYSGGSDSDIMIDLIERTRNYFNTACGHEALKPVKYVFFNTGLEMKATKDHVKATAAKYGVEIEERRPKIGIVQAAKKYGVPFYSKIFSQRLHDYQKKQIPLSIISEFQNATDKQKKFQEINERYPKCKTLINFLLSINANGEAMGGQLSISSAPFFADFLKDFPPAFPISAKCCDFCKKQLAHQVQKDYEMIITGEREAEGGVRSVNKTLVSYNMNNTMCFAEQSNGQYRFRPLYYVSDKDKEWYKSYYNIRYSDAYEVYGLKRTGCCGCPISSRAIEELERIGMYEPNIAKAAWNIFGDSYRYRQKYNEYKSKRREEERRNKDQITFEEGDNL